MTHDKPYYAVIFTSVRFRNAHGYDEMAARMIALAKQQPGFLGVASVSNEVGITVSYWESPEAIKYWKQQAEHLVAQRKGRAEWYKWYNVKICKIEREYEFGSPPRSLSLQKEERSG